ncbi:protein pinocchio isoform X1 [Frankliniella occidentalis]|uniref:Protein pinocchio isoform X1 n=1 Tax=Frankliniella occidentalis TaxID=133901 RepID=A0A9C6U3G3_FRAOC|nr:protein pinocchio isoform X1 [Frankliniella occidentalis]
MQATFSPSPRLAGAGWRLSRGETRCWPPSASLHTWRCLQTVWNVQKDAFTLAWTGLAVAPALGHILFANFDSSRSLSSPMSIARVETMRMLNKSQSLSLSSISSLDDAHISFSVANSANSTASVQEPVVSIEELRLQLNSCFTCGVSWHEDHVSLDCQECGGYSLERPCPRCDGRCGGTWKRDLTMSHASGKARWEGKCLHSTSTQMIKNLVSEDESHLCSRLEKLTASS